MDTRQLIDELKKIEPHIDGPLQQEKYFTIHLVDPNDPTITRPLTNVRARFVTVVADEHGSIIENRLVIALS